MASAAQKAVMKFSKKLREIEKIEARMAAGERVDPLQLKKVEGKAAVLADLATAQEISVDASWGGSVLTQNGKVTAIILQCRFTAGYIHIRFNEAGEVARDVGNVPTNKGDRGLERGDRFVKAEEGPSILTFPASGPHSTLLERGTKLTFKAARLRPSARCRERPVMLTVRKIDGDMLLGPESLSSATTVADVMRRLIAEKKEPVDVKILHESHNLEESIRLADIERAGAVELNVVFMELVITATFLKSADGMWGDDATRIEIAPGTREALEATVAEGPPEYRFPCCPLEVKTMTGQELLEKLDIMEEYLKQEPLKAEQLQALIRGAKEAACCEYSFDGCMSRTGGRVVDAVVAGHRITSERNYDYG